MTSLLIKNGRVIDPARGSDTVADLLIENGKIAAIGQAANSADITIDAEGMLVVPGLIDMHTHLREPGYEQAETIKSGTRAAVCGGFTAVAVMPNTKPCIDTAKMARFVEGRAREVNLGRVLVVGAVTVGRQGQELAELEAMAAAGAVAFSDDGDCVPTVELMRKALAEAGRLKRPIIQHCENPQTPRGHVNAGAAAQATGLSGSGGDTEASIVERDLKLLGDSACRYHVAHVSAAQTVEVIRKAKLRGVNVTAEVSPHHLALTDELCRSLDPVYKVRPPLRGADDVAALKAGLADGTIDCLACDHAPHTSESKALSFAQAPAGMIGLETALGVYVTELIEGGVLNWMQLVEKLTTKPAAVLGLDEPRLSEGQVADITIIDPGRRWTVRIEKFRSKGRNCPFADRTLIGKAVGTIVAGRVCYLDCIRVAGELGPEVIRD